MPRNCRYKNQQYILNQIANKLGVVAYRPNYHGAAGDKNTVLFYTKEDHQANVEMDKNGGPPWRPDGCEGYRRYFWSFENSDVNGFATYDFANHGRLDLRGLREAEVLEGAVRFALARHKQIKYASACGGFLEVREADETFNDFNREIIQAVKQQYGCAFLGNINFYDRQRKAVVAGEQSVYKEYDGGQVYNFECSFVVPVADAALEQLIVKWNADDSLPKGAQDVERITSLVEKIGGANLIWY